MANFLQGLATGFFSQGTTELSRDKEGKRRADELRAKQADELDSYKQKLQLELDSKKDLKQFETDLKSEQERAASESAKSTLATYNNNLPSIDSPTVNSTFDSMQDTKVFKSSSIRSALQQLELEPASEANKKLKAALEIQLEDAQEREKRKIDIQGLEGANDKYFDYVESISDASSPFHNNLITKSDTSHMDSLDNSNTFLSYTLQQAQYNNLSRLTLFNDAVKLEKAFNTLSPPKDDQGNAIYQIKNADKQKAAKTISNLFEARGYDINDPRVQKLFTKDRVSAYKQFTGQLTPQEDPSIKQLMDQVSKGTMTEQEAIARALRAGYTPEQLGYTEEQLRGLIQ